VCGDGGVDLLRLDFFLWRFDGGDGGLGLGVVVGIGEDQSGSSFWEGVGSK
jgi:hypothetical protein